MAREDPAYLEWLREQPCCACGKWGWSTPHHKTGAGMGKRAHDHEAMPLCVGCHKDLHEFSGRFALMGQLSRADWQDTQIREHRAMYQDGPAVVPF